MRRESKKDLWGYLVIRWTVFLSSCDSQGFQLSHGSTPEILSDVDPYPVGNYYHPLRDVSLHQLTHRLARFRPSFLLNQRDYLPIICGIYREKHE